MRIAYVGGFEVSWHTETHCADALEDLGQTVDRIESRSTSWGEIVRRAELRDFDLLLLTARPIRGASRGAGPALERIRENYVPIVSYHLDIYSGLARGLDVGLDAFWKADFVFTADGGTSEKVWSRKGVRHRWLCGAIPEAEVYRGERDARFDCRVAFVGGAEGYLREWPYRRELLDFLARRYGSEFRAFPGKGPRIHGDDLNRLYATADVVVGDSYCPSFIHERYWSDRIYQTVGRGGVFVHPEVGGIRYEYPEGVFETYHFGDWIELGQKIDALLDDPPRREVMRDRGVKETLERHTYRHRMATLLDVVEREFFR